MRFPNLPSRPDQDHKKMCRFLNYDKVYFLIYVKNKSEIMTEK